MNGQTPNGGGVFNWNVTRVSIWLVGVVGIILAGWWGIESQIEAMIINQAPYVKDRSMIMRQLETVDDIQDSINDLQRGLARVEGKLDTLLTDEARRRERVKVP